MVRGYSWTLRETDSSGIWGNPGAGFLPSLPPGKGHSSLFLPKRKHGTLCPGKAIRGSVPRRAAPPRSYTGEAARASRHPETVSAWGAISQLGPGAVGRGLPSKRAQACRIHSASAHLESQYCEYQGLFRPFLFLFNVLTSVPLVCQVLSLFSFFFS